MSTALKARMKELSGQAEVLRRKAIDTPDKFTEADADQATTIAKEYASVSALAQRSEAAADALQKAGAGTEAPAGWHDGGGFVGDGFGQASFTGRGGVPTISQNERAKPFTGQLLKALAAAAPAIGGPSVQKALISTGSVTAGFDGRVIMDPEAAFNVRAAINMREVNTAAGTYLRQTLKTNNAAPVVPGSLKPISSYALEPKEWKIATIAHISEPISLQWLEDFPMLEQFLAVQLGYGLEEAIADYILNGGTAEDGTTVSGILTTTGVVQTPYTTSPLRTIRKAIGELDVNGVTATGILLNPADWEALETTTTTTGEFLLPLAPQASPERKLWSTPVTLSKVIPAGQAVIGDLSSVSLLYRNSQRLEWGAAMTDTGTQAVPAPRDLFRRNEVVFRSEIRVGLEILSIPSLRVADLTAA